MPKSLSCFSKSSRIEEMVVFSSCKQFSMMYQVRSSSAFPLNLRTGMSDGLWRSLPPETTATQLQTSLISLHNKDTNPSKYLQPMFVNIAEGPLPECLSTCPRGLYCVLRIPRVKWLDSLWNLLFVKSSLLFFRAFHPSYDFVIGPSFLLEDLPISLQQCKSIAVLIVAPNLVDFCDLESQKPHEYGGSGRTTLKVVKSSNFFTQYPPSCV